MWYMIIYKVQVITRLWFGFQWSVCRIDWGSWSHSQWKHRSQWCRHIWISMYWTLEADAIASQWSDWSNSIIPYIIIHFFVCVRYTEPPPTSQAKTWRTPRPFCWVLSWCCATWDFMGTLKRSRPPASTPFGKKR